MAASITVSDVKAGYSTEVPDDEIGLLIQAADQADACLDGSGVPEEKQKLLKLLAVRHMLSLIEGSGRGKAISEGASGAFRSFGAWQGQGLGSTRFGAMLLQLDSTGCVSNLLSNSQRLGIWSVGRRC